MTLPQLSGNFKEVFFSREPDAKRRFEIPEVCEEGILGVAFRARFPIRRNLGELDAEPKGNDRSFQEERMPEFFPCYGPQQCCREETVAERKVVQPRQENGRHQLFKDRVAHLLHFVVAGKTPSLHPA